MKSAFILLGRSAYAVLTTLALVGCDRDGGPATSEGQSGPASSTPPKAETLVLLGMQDYFNLELLDLFQKETGVRIDYQLYEEPDEVEPRLRSKPGSADLIVIDSFNLQKLRQLRLLRELDKSALAQLGQCRP